MKQSIAWHKECLKNLALSLGKEKMRIDSASIRLVDSQKRFEEYEAQIALAEKRGLTAFDGERLGKKRGK